MFKYLKYQFAWGGQRAGIPSLLPICIGVLSLFVLLQHLMIGTETWLSSEMSTVSYLQIAQDAATYHGS